MCEGSIAPWIHIQVKEVEATAIVTKWTVSWTMGPLKLRFHRGPGPLHFIPL